MIEYCVMFCRHNQQSVVSAALRAVGNIVTGDDIQTQVTNTLFKKLHAAKYLDSNIIWIAVQKICLFPRDIHRSI